MPYLFLLLIWLPLHATANPVSNWWDSQEPARKVRYTQLGGAAAITVWGVAHWDYFARAPHSDSEGWFQHDTQTGGADKVGHLYSTYISGIGLTYLYQSWGYEPRKAAQMGAWSAFGLMNLMEVGDAFSKNYGFSWEDMVMNSAGAGLSYARKRIPSLAQRLDLRVEYSVGGDNSADIFTDYENTRYLLALKLAGYPRYRHSWLRYLEWHTGYYTRGYDDDDAGKRYAYVGLGLNLSEWLNERGHARSSSILRYLQLPGTSLRDNHLLD